MEKKVQERERERKPDVESNRNYSARSSHRNSSGPKLASAANENLPQTASKNAMAVRALQRKGYYKWAFWSWNGY